MARNMFAGFENQVLYYTLNIQLAHRKSLKKIIWKCTMGSKNDDNHQMFLTSKIPVSLGKAGF